MAAASPYARALLLVPSHAPGTCALLGTGHRAQPRRRQSNSERERRPPVAETRRRERGRVRAPALRSMLETAKGGGAYRVEVGGESIAPQLERTFRLLVFGGRLHNLVDSKATQTRETGRRRL